MVDDVRASVPSFGGVVAATESLLSEVDDLDEGATGVLRFSEAGMVLVESNAICWSIASGMSGRLTSLLRAQRSPPIDEQVLEELIANCRTHNIPIGEALLASGQVSEQGLRAALLRQTTEALMLIAKSGVSSDQFTPHTHTGYDARFTFSTVEVLAHLGARRRRARAAAARRELEAALPADTAAFAFVLDSAEAIPVCIAAARVSRLRTCDVLDVCGLVERLFDGAARFDARPRLICLQLRGRTSLVAWHADNTYFAALCETRAAMVSLQARLSPPRSEGKN